jgi:nicotinate-nucleotide adenylyltransferase
VCEPERIGVYGGTFDPIHKTHVAIARAAMEAKQLDRVLFVVANIPPHKRGEVCVDATDRLAMVECALTGEAGMEACRIELDREGPSYTVDTLADLRSRYPSAAFYLIVGSDSLRDMHKWYRPEAICEQAKLLVVSRPESSCVATGLDCEFEVIEVAESATSSTEIRQRIATGKSVTKFLAPAVEKVIEERGLYYANR